MVTPSSLEALQRENEELRAELVDLHGAADQTATRVMILTQERDEARCDSIAAQEAEAQAIRDRDEARAALRDALALIDDITIVASPDGTDLGGLAVVTSETDRKIETWRRALGEPAGRMDIAWANFMMLYLGGAKRPDDLARP